MKIAQKLAKMVELHIAPKSKMYATIVGFVTAVLVSFGLDASLVATIAILCAGGVTVVFVYLIPNTDVTKALEKWSKLDLNQNQKVGE